jgi:preprotein translocase subunit YajC
VPVQPPWILAASTAKSNSGGSGFIIIILFGFALLYLFTRSQKNARRKAAAAQGAIELGSKVITNSGMYATVVRVDDATYDLEVDTDVIITFAKVAVTRLQPVVESDETDTADAGDAHADGHDHEHGDHDHDHDDEHAHDQGDTATVITSLTKEPQHKEPQHEDPARSSSDS